MVWHGFEMLDLDASKGAVVANSFRVRHAACLGGIDFELDFPIRHMKTDCQKNIFHEEVQRFFLTILPGTGPVVAAFQIA